MHVGRPRGDRNLLEGDIVVMAVAVHYAIGRLKADGKTLRVPKILTTSFPEILATSR
jgi:hypothetical protein